MENYGGFGKERKKGLREEEKTRAARQPVCDSEEREVEAWD